MKYTSLVTGGAGFIGSHVAKHLLALDHHVIVLDDLSGGNTNNLPPDADFVEGSITDQQTVDAIFAANKIDYVFHLAAYAAEGLSHFIRKFNYENNLIGSTLLINAAVKHKVKCFVFTSSIAVYGDNPLPHTEAQRPSPTDPYGIAKYAVELDLRAAHQLFGLNHIVFRPHNVYGPHQNLEDNYRNVVGIFMRQVLQQQPMTIFGDGTQTRAFTYIDDVAPCIAQSINNPEAYNRCFNIGGDAATSVREIAEKVAQALRKTPKINFLEAREEALHSYCSHDALTSMFKVRPPVSLEDGLQRMADWASTQKLGVPSTFGALEITEKLPRSWQAK